jgi:hypothetical protein
MIFKCFCCEKWRFQSKKDRGALIVRANDGTRELPLCSDCADGIDTRYLTNKKLSEMDGE